MALSMPVLLKIERLPELRRNYLTGLPRNRSGFRRDLGSAQAISRECKSAFVINVHI